MDRKIQEKLILIKQDFRALMNGPISHSLREKGLGYRLIYGIEWPRLIQLSNQVGKNHDLAQALWKEDIRECRLLAGLVQPIEDFYPELADLWVESMHYPEEAQYTVLSLFQNLPYASQKAFQWIADNREMFELCGWYLLTRMFMKGHPLNEISENEFVDQAYTSIQNSNFHIRSAVRNAVHKYAQIGEREELRMGKIFSLCNF